MGHLLCPGSCASILKATCPMSGSADGGGAAEAHTGPWVDIVIKHT